MRIYLLLAMAAGLSFVGSNCGGDGVGDPCTPEGEYITTFSGFSQSEVNVESRSFQCVTRVCLVNHFQGRVSCPYGQVEDPTGGDSGLATCMGTLENRNSIDCQPGGALHRDSCQVPDRDGSLWEERIVLPVEPQLKERQAEDAVYCSCRCDGDDANFDYCDCPTGFVCEKLIEDLGISDSNLSGSYCVKEGTEYDPGAPETVPCSSSQASCNEKYTITFSEDSPVPGKVGTNQKRACLPSGAVCGENDTCCKVEVTDCTMEENCFAPSECVGSNCVHPNGGGSEVLYNVERVECKDGDTCQ